MNIDYLCELGFKQFFIQNNDEYVFRPDDTKFIDILSKQDWGMICVSKN